MRLTVLACALLLAVPASSAASGSRNPFPPMRHKNESAYRAAKQRAIQGPMLRNPLARLGAPFAPSPRAQILTGLNQPGLNSDDNSAANDGTPPDPTGAVGPNDYIEFVNSVVRLYSKSNLTTIADTQQLDTFVGEAGDSVFDPQIQYDPVSDRWYYLADDCTTFDCVPQHGSDRNRLAYGFSKSGDPSNMTTDWCRYTIRVDDAGGTDLFDDYPKLGHNDTHLIFGTNVFSPTDFVSSRVWTVAKPANGTITTCPAAATPHYYTGDPGSIVEDAADLTADPLTTSSTGHPFAFTPVPANTQDSSANGYVVAAADPPGNTIMTWHVNNTGVLVADGNIGVTSFSMPAPVPQPGTSDVLDSSDTRLTQAVAHEDPDASNAEAVWTQHTIDGPGGRSVDRWYELLPATTSKRQEGNISDPNNFVFNGAIAPAMTGNEAVIEYNVGGSSQLAQVKAQSRTSGRPLGQMGGEVLLGTSTHFDQDFSCPSSDPLFNPSCRWGDYAAATPDPDGAATHTVWGTNQLIGDPDGADPTAPHWTTRNFALVADEGPIASFNVSPNPAFTKKNVTFDGSASHDTDGGTPSFEWDFGDGNFVAGGSQVTHSYSSPGKFTVRVRVSDSNGGTPDVASQTLTINSGVPSAAFTVSPTSIIRNQSVTFDGSASHDAEVPGGIASYAWDFDGDGTTDQTTTSPTVTHAYTTLGTFTPKLTVIDADDGDASPPVAGNKLTVTNAPPTAKISFSPSQPVAGSAVTIDGTGSNDPDGPIVDYDWDLDGNGTFETDSGTNPQVSKTFASAGNFPVALRVHDADGATSMANTTVTVVAQPKLKLRLKFSKKAKLATLLKRGLSGKVTCNKPCVVRLTIKISKKLAKTLHTKTTIARVTVRMTSSGTKSVSVVLTKKSRKALAKAPAMSVTLTGKATDSSKVSSSAKLTVRVKP